MKKTLYTTAFLAAALSGAFTAYSQNLDPTVEVSRTYVAKKIEVNKTLIEMEVPDTVMKFDLDFDYSVNDNPYKGSYEFTPYVLDMKPESHNAGGGMFFLRAGAGYGLHPTVDFVFTPNTAGSPFTMSIYGNHRSYFGNYRDVALTTGEDGVQRFAKVPDSHYSGYQSATLAGLDGRADWNSGFFSFDVAYLGHADKDDVRTRGYDAVRAQFRAASQNDAARYFFYDAAVGYQFGEDKINQFAGGKSYVTGHDFSMKVTIGPVLSPSSKALMDICADVSEYGSSVSLLAGRFSLVPRYVFSKDRWNFDIGVNFSCLFGKDWNDTGLRRADGGQFFYPAAGVGFEAIPGYMNIFVRADGGEKVNRYSEIISYNRHFSPLYTRSGTDLLGCTVERVNAVLGFKGNISSRFLYELKGGYADYDGYVCDAAGYDGVGWGTLVPGIGYGKFSWFYAALDLQWHSQDVDAGLKASYHGRDLIKPEESAALFAPSPFTAGSYVIYNWKKRIFAGLHCTAATRRKAVIDTIGEVRVPGYADLGVSAEYRFSRKLSFWLYGGNLLNMTIQRTPLYAESGISLTAGITLNL